MGACATKPKVLKAEGGEAPAPEPESAQEEVVAGTKLDNDGDGKAAEVVDDDKGDSKPHSLSHLLTDQKEGNKESDEKEKTAAADPLEKQEPTLPSENNPPVSEPPPSDTVTEKTTIINSSNKLVETPSEPDKENHPENEEPIEDKVEVEVINENPPPLEKTESSEKPTESDKEVKVITN